MNQQSQITNPKSLRVLEVGSNNRHMEFAPFIVEQAEALKQLGCEIDYFGVQGGGIMGYLRNRKALMKKIAAFQPNVIHAHYGLCGLLANLQRKVPVVTTYHGSDINERKVLPFSRLSMALSAWNIFVSKRTMRIVCPHKRYSLFPCGIELPKEENELQCLAEIQSKLTPKKKHILFAGAFDNKVKNYPLAKAVVDLTPEAELIELKGYNREQVWAMMYACDAFLMTSFTEGSPQVIKEAMACGCPIVSVDVGDVAERVEGLEGCYVAKTREPEELAELLKKAMVVGRTKGREKIVADGLSNEQVAKRLVEIYQSVVKL